MDTMNQPPPDQPPNPLGLLSIGTLHHGLELLLQTGAMANAPQQLRDLARRCFMTGAWLSYSIQQVAVRRALAQRPDEATALLQHLVADLQGFEVEARLAEAEADMGRAAAAAGQVH